LAHSNRRALLSAPMSVNSSTLNGMSIMNVIARLIVVLGCTAVGAAAGFKLALVSEHNQHERNKTSVRQSHEEVWSQKSDERALAFARQIYAKDIVVHNPAGGSTGFDGFFEGIRENRADFPDWSEKVESMVAEGDFVASDFRQAARRRGTWIHKNTFSLRFLARVGRSICRRSRSFASRTASWQRCGTSGTTGIITGS
jgi:hypothetical protein